MKTFIKLSLFNALLLTALLCNKNTLANVGFSIPDSVREVSFHYHSVRGLILLPVVLNDTVHVNLILDTGCRNLVLFGKRFEKLFDFQVNRKVKFSGLGQGKPVVGSLSLSNKVSIAEVIGERIPVVVVPNQNVFSGYHKVHGIIGYDIFIKFEVELNFADQIITFRRAWRAVMPEQYERIPIRIVDSRPMIRSRVFFNGQEGQACELMIDTGSSLGLLLKTTDLKRYPESFPKGVLGRGINGNIEGSEAYPDRLLMEAFEIAEPPAGIVYSQWHNYASVGMQVMRNYSIVLNYCQAYVGIKKGRVNRI
ncbi:aspartyl protease family protein [Chryseolinea lacunae]|uniref:Aspartyl protease family protein n=1 Tax=Chryseolinea lacunae TaxID=2801331 RepID=A0ABS1L0B6_9BACT|nr:aspartyl protease family protein [Chryseolinea lacunae]MBL0745135.1 aspartyl protease family protein [Chryseolinea lacunae]